MEIVKKTEEYQIVKKRNGRYGVRTLRRKWITGEDKVKILVAEGLVKASEPKKEEPEADAGADADAGTEAGAGADAGAGAGAGAEAGADAGGEADADKDAG